MFSTFTLNYLTIYECSLTGHSMREWKTTKHEQHSRTKKERLKKAEWIASFKTPFTCLGSNINQSNFQISHKMSWSEDLLSYPHVSDWNISESVVLIWKKTAAGKESSWRLFPTGGRLRPKSLLDYMDLDDHHCWLFSSLCFCLSVFTFLEGKAGWRKEQPWREVNRVLGSSLLLVCLGKERTWLHITHSLHQHTCEYACECICLRGSAYACTWLGECERGEVFQSRELERITGNVWEGREKSRRGCESKKKKNQKKKLKDWVKEVMRSVTVDRGSTGVVMEKLKGNGLNLDVRRKVRHTKTLAVWWTKLFRGKEGKGSHQK